MKWVGLGQFEINYLNMWAPFHSRKGSCASRLGCKPRGKGI